MAKIAVSTKRFAPGIYRVRDGGTVFGQVRKHGRMWIAEIRKVETGAMVCPAGIWASLADAAEECAHLMPRYQTG